MRKSIVLLVILMLISIPAFASSTAKAQYSVPKSQAFEDYINEQDCITHSHVLDKEKKVQRTVGLDLVIYDNDTVELTSENRYNFNTNVTTLGGVVKVKKSLFSLVSGLFKKE